MPNFIPTISKKLSMDELFTGTGAVNKVALFQSAWNPTEALTQYSATNEATGGNYTAGGETLSNVSVAQDGTAVRLTFTNPSWTNLGSGTQVTYRWILLYRSDQSTNNARAVWDLGADRTVSGASETLEFGVGSNAPLSF